MYETKCIPNDNHSEVQISDTLPDPRNFNLLVIFYTFVFHIDGQKALASARSRYESSSVFFVSGCMKQFRTHRMMLIRRAWSVIFFIGLPDPRNFEFRWPYYDLDCNCGHLPCRVCYYILLKHLTVAVVWCVIESKLPLHYRLLKYSYFKIISTAVRVASARPFSFSVKIWNYCNYPQRNYEFFRN